MTDKKPTLTIRLPKEELETLDEHAERSDRTKTEIFREFIRSLRTGQKS
jgi:predicted DNA-binding protein